MFNFVTYIKFIRFKNIVFKSKNNLYWWCHFFYLFNKYFYENVFANF